MYDLDSMEHHGSCTNAECWQQGSGEQRGQPRPPVLFKKHEPCRDTTKMDVMAFMDHLKGLDWYSGQVSPVPV